MGSVRRICGIGTRRQISSADIVGRYVVSVYMRCDADKKMREMVCESREDTQSKTSMPKSMASSLTACGDAVHCVDRRRSFR